MAPEPTKAGSRGRAATRAVERHGGGGARRTLLRVVGTAAALVLVVLVVHGLRRASGTGEGAEVPPAGPLAVVEGEVAEPGAIPVVEGATVGDVVELAGGERDGIEPRDRDRSVTPWTRLTVQDGHVTVTTLTPGERFALGGTLDPNLATAGELAEVPGLSETLAGRVIESRDEAPFCAIEELERVRGIGPRKVEWMRPFLSIDTIAAGCSASP